MKFDEKFLNSRKRMEFDLNRLLNLTWRWSLECSSCWIFFAAESSCKCTEKLNLICRCRTFGFHFSSATNFGWLSLDQFLMLRKNRQKLPEKATFRKVHNRTSLIAHNASLRNYCSWFTKLTKKIYLSLWRENSNKTFWTTRSSFYFDGCKAFMDDDRTNDLGFVGWNEQN